MRFDVGCQPCKNFLPARYGGLANRHQCYRGRATTCAMTVSYCENCDSDHHEGGWDTCDGPDAPAAASCENETCRKRYEAALVAHLRDGVRS